MEVCLDFRPANTCVYTLNKTKHTIATRVCVSVLRINSLSPFSRYLFHMSETTIKKRQQQQNQGAQQYYNASPLSFSTSLWSKEQTKAHQLTGVSWRKPLLPTARYKVALGSSQPSSALFLHRFESSSLSYFHHGFYTAMLSWFSSAVRDLSKPDFTSNARVTTGAWCILRQQSYIIAFSIPRTVTVQELWAAIIHYQLTH